MEETELKKNIYNPDFADKNAIKMMRDLVPLAKRADVRSVIVMTVTADNHVDWGIVTESEHHALLLAMALEDARQEIKDSIFNESVD